MQDKSFNSISKGLNISNERCKHIISYVQRIIKDYKGHPVDMIKEIPLNLKGNERYFAIFVIGNSFSSIFLEMDIKKKADFLVNIADALKLSDERLELIGNYVSDAVRKHMKGNISTVEIIKGIIDSNYSDIEKDYMIFNFGIF